MSVITKTLTHGAKMQLCTLLLKPWFMHRPDRTYGRMVWIRRVLGERALCAVGAQLAVIAACGRMPTAGAIVIVDAATQETTEIATDEAPPIIRALLRFTMAAGRSDSAGAWAVWLSIPHDERIGFAMSLVSVAATHLESHMDSDHDDEVPDDARELTEGAS